MDFNEYQNECKKTTNFEGSDCEIISNMCLGIAGEAGEVVDYMKKCMFGGYTYSQEKLTEELGDLLWYVTALATEHYIPLERIAKQNVEKLQKRYPKGRFTKEDSLKRRDIELKSELGFDNINKLIKEINKNG